MSRVFCTECGAPSLASDKFCTGCGADLGQQLTQAGPQNGDTVAMSIEVRENRDSRWPLLVGVAATVVVVGALGYFMLLRPGATPSVASNTAPPRVEIPSASPRPSESEAPPESETSGPRPTVTVTQDVPTSAVAASPIEVGGIDAPDQALALSDAEARAELAELRRQDRRRLGSLYDSWVPKLSAKRVGLRVDIRPNWTPNGRAETESVTIQEILGFQLALDQRYDAITIRDSDIGRGGSPAMWVSLADQSFATGNAANRWCDDQGIPVNECYALRVVPAGEPGGRSKPRG